MDISFKLICVKIDILTQGKQPQNDIDDDVDFGPIE